MVACTDAGPPADVLAFRDAVLANDLDTAWGLLGDGSDLLADTYVDAGVSIPELDGRDGRARTSLALSRAHFDAVFSETTAWSFLDSPLTAVPATVTSSDGEPFRTALRSTDNGVVLDTRTLYLTVTYGRTDFVRPTGVVVDACLRRSSSMRCRPLGA